jgi:ABC-type branched-subunit amino acid transport system substrate-binding protein
MKRAARAVRILTLSGLLLAGCTGSEPPRSDDEPECTWVVGTMGGLSGEGSETNIRIFRAIELAVDTALERSEVACQIELASEDTTGDADRARARARSLVANDRLVACVCPYRSVETLVSGTIFTSHGVLMASTGTSDEIVSQGFDTWFRVHPNESIQAEGTAEYIRGVLKPKATAIIDDGSNQGVRLGDEVGRHLGDLVGERASLSTTDAGTFAQSLSKAPPEIVYYAGSAGAGGQVAAALRSAEVDSLVIVAGAEPGAVPTAADLGAATDVLVVCPCVDPSAVAEGADFADAYSQAYDELPGMFTTEVFDVTALVIDALEGLSGDTPIEEVRAAVVSHFDDADGARGISGELSWTPEGEREVDALESVWVYDWDPGRGVLEPTGPVATLL